MKFHLKTRSLMILSSRQLQADGYHTSPTHQRTPLVPRDLGEDFNLDYDEESSRPLDPRKPKNAK